jgi:hypothetical protein
MGKYLKLDEAELLNDYVNYMAQSDIWEKNLMWKAATCSDAISCRKGLCSSKVISKIAVRVLMFPASLASCERNWKTHALIKKRTGLQLRELKS